ncbi:WGR domain-containing protein [Shimia sp. R9_1]|uniref:WGR domain-containing protein n=1 Tax=unclassified Shimia TaxID=2630038 RepID=UPI001ADBD7D5|nr:MULTISPECIES: WGR domain-containing protein [unclassified Shimia]MBO9395871.1 WGR domain-containing protein [Shimia sp. R9_2]MBO9400001.1 WGR domain-containing protein [Shimia sp. R9_3]MBO9407885.1 WGR domain-containing protein [Shimia sp. R9_1]
MAICIMYKPALRTRPRYYRVEIAMNLFEEVSVMREWGVKGGKGRTMISIFGNLRDASLAADGFRRKALRKGYARS